MGEEWSPAVQCRYFCKTPRLSPQVVPANPSSCPPHVSSFYTLPATSGSPLAAHALSVAEMIGRQSENSYLYNQQQMGGKEQGELAVMEMDRTGSGS